MRAFGCPAIVVVCDFRATIAPVERRPVWDAVAHADVATAQAARRGSQRAATTIRSASLRPRRRSRLNARGMAPEDLEG